MSKPSAFLLVLLVAVAVGSALAAGISAKLHPERSPSAVGVSDPHSSSSTAATMVESQSCSESDASMKFLRKKICASLAQGPTWWCGTYWTNTSSHEDWPSQAMYWQNLLNFLAAPTTCLNTSYAVSTVDWLENVMSNDTIGFMDQYIVFQVQYYDMPRKPGARIESAFTLGEKCFAFALLNQYWNGKTLLPRVEAAGLNLTKFTSAYTASMPVTLNLCREVKNNCFVNASYDPKRAGSCPTKYIEFDAGFDWEEVKQHIKVHNPW